MKTLKFRCLMKVFPLHDVKWSEYNPVFAKVDDAANMESDETHRDMADQIVESLMAGWYVMNVTRYKVGSELLVIQALHTQWTDVMRVIIAERAGDD